MVSIMKKLFCPRFYEKLERTAISQKKDNIQGRCLKQVESLILSVYGFSFHRFADLVRFPKNPVF